MPLSTLWDHEQDTARVSGRCPAIIETFIYIIPTIV